MPQFALLLPHAPDRYAGLNEDDYMAIIKDYIAWVEKAAADGVYQGGHKLTDSPIKTLTSGNGGVEVHDSPSTEVAEILGGVMIIEAPDLAGAVEVAREHPHLKHNTTLEIRAVDAV